MSGTDDLERNRKALFERRLAESGLAPPTAPTTALSTPPPIGRRPDRGEAPLSFAQQRLWFLDQLEPSGAAYNVPGVLRLSGSLDVERLTLAMGRIVERHEVLRTTFAERDGDPVQVVGRAPIVPFTQEDLSPLPGPAQAAAVRMRARRESETGFDLRTGPFLRLALLRCAADEHILLFTMHHIVSDQWSLDILARELAHFYASPDRQLPPLPIQYGDYAAWQRTWRASAAFDRHLTWWRDTLRQLDPLQLATDHPRPSASSYRGAAHRFEISGDERRALEVLGQSVGATPFMTLLALFMVMLSRDTRQGDIAVGTPVANRNESTLQHLVGFFTNTLVVRSHIDGASTFIDCLAKMRERCLETYRHEAMPFEALVEVLQPARELNRNPFFDVMFVFQTDLPPVTLPGLAAEFLDQEVTASKFDLTLTLRERAGGWQGWIEYATDLFDRPTIVRIAARFQTLVTSAIANPRSRVDELERLSAGERRQVLLDLNATAVVFDGDQLVHGLFEKQARLTPAAIAVVSGDVQLTYAELDARTNQLAHLLVRLGAGPEAAIGICLGRSVDLIVALLAILKSGSVYVPLDPSYPADRLAYMLADADAGLLLVDRHTADQFPADASRQTVVLDNAWPDVSVQPATAVVSGVAADNLLYFMYTSGSTGRPKGAGLSHRALHNLIRWHHDTLLTGVPTLQFAPLSFDASFHEIFAALGSGGALHIATEDERRDVDALVAHLLGGRIVKVILPVVVFQQLAALYADRSEPFADLREILVTGEQLLLTPAIHAFCARLPHCALHNHYGPTEAHVVTSYTFGAPPSQLLPPPPIGKPIANTQIYLLDERLNPVPIGVAAELYIGGANLARGYHARPDLTAERFVPHPYPLTPGERLYRTGDLARHLAGGDIEFLGRIDAQMKVRGFRVEPGEVETALSRHPAVAQSAVAVREVVPGNPGLVAFVVPDGGAAIDAETLIAFLSATLPDYLVPSHVAIVDSLPLTPSGKVDRRALPTPARTTGETFRPPATPADRWMAARWAELLGLDRVGMRDHFFRLGGHSLLATRLVSRVRHALQIELPVRLLFEQPVLEAFVAGVAERGGGRPRLEAITETLLQVDSLTDEDAHALLDQLRVES